MTYYIAKLDEEFGIPYIPTKGYNPEEFFIIYSKNFGNIYNAAMVWAAEGGHLKIVKYLIDEKGATHVNDALEWAAKKGHLDIVKYLIDEKGADDFNWALEDAAHGGHLDIVQLMIEKGASKFNNAMINAAEGGYLDIVKYLIEKAREKNHLLDFDYAIVRAKDTGNPEIVEYLKQFV